MKKCIRCGEYFEAYTKRSIGLCEECAEYELERGITRCRGCGTIIDSEELVRGLCEKCRDSYDNDNYDDGVELVSFEEEFDDDFNDDFNDDFEDYYDR